MTPKHLISSTIAGSAALLLLASCHSGAGAGGRAHAAAPDAGDAGRPSDVVLASSDAGETISKGDLPEIQKRGVLRVLVAGTAEDFLPREGMPSSLDRRLAREAARRLGVKAELVLVPSHADLLPMLVAGRGDVVAARLAITEQRQKLAAFTRPLAVVDEMLVAGPKTPDPPKTLTALAGRHVAVRASSSYAETLAALSQAGAKGVVVDDMPERLDTEQIVYRVTEGKLPLTVVDSDILQAIETYDDEVRPLFPIKKNDHIAWAVRKSSPKLRAALDAFLMEKALTAHTERRFTGDLDGIKRRGVLRVITRNNPVTYFLYRGRQEGFDYELARKLADELGVRLAMVVPPSRDQLLPWLLEGRGDLIAASLTVTKKREKKVAFSAPYLHVEEMLVGKKGGPRVKHLAELAGKTVEVRPSSSYHATLEAIGKKVPGIHVVAAPESMETEELVARVADGEVPYTVADSDILLVELTWRDDVVPEMSLTAPDAKPGAWRDLTTGTKSIAFAVRKTSPKLLAYASAFVKKTYRGAAYNLAKRRYFHDKKQIRRIKRGRVGAGGHLSPYDALIKKWSAHYGLDWRLMAATAFQESRFDPKAKSWVGALGLFQVMPETAHALGFRHPERPAQGVHAGIEYIHRLIAKLDPSLPLRVRVRMALAAYNAGLGHVADARRLAARLGLDPDKWFGNTEKAMLLLSKPRYYRHARYGYCRGSEPVAYVSEIQSRYDDYVKIVKQ